MGRYLKPKIKRSQSERKKKKPRADFQETNAMSETRGQTTRKKKTKIHQKPQAAGGKRIQSKCQRPVGRHPKKNKEKHTRDRRRQVAFLVKY